MNGKRPASSAGRSSALSEGEGTLRDMAVFYRTNAQSRVVEDALVADGIPYHMVGGMRFYERMEIKDILAYLKVLDNPADEIALKRIINTPPRGIGHATVDKIAELAAQKGMLFYDALREAATGKLLATGPRGKVAAFVRDAGAVQRQLADDCRSRNLPHASSRKPVMRPGSRKSGATRRTTAWPTSRSFWRPWKSSSGPARRQDPVGLS